MDTANAKIIKSFVTFNLFEGLAISFFFGTYQLFLIQKGLSLLEINLLNACFMIANFLFEIPTGAIADFFGKKRSVIAGLWVYAISFLIYFLADHFWQFLLAEIIGAIAFACISGALEALIVDALRANHYPGNLEKIFKRAEIRGIGIVIGATIGGFVGQVNLAWPWLLTSIAFVIFAFSAYFFLPNDYRRRTSQVKFSWQPLKIIAQESIAYGLKNRRFMFMVIFSAILAFVFQPLNMYWPLVLKQNFSLEIKYLGLVFSAITILMYLGAQFSEFWQARFICPKKAMFWSQIITAIGIVGASLMTSLPTFLSLFLLHEFGRGLFKPLMRAYINNNIASQNRSTVLSFESMIVKAGSGLGLIVSGFLADSLGILTTWLISGVILIISIIYFSWKNNYEV